MNKRKIINDPVHGFIKVPFDLLYDLSEHPYFQRLRRIKQLGLTHLVYPGAMHTRFQHALGAMHLMSSAVETLQSKGHEITKEESLAVHAAILLHDIGHGPFSHVLEHSLVEVSHEEISQIFMQKLNEEYNGQLTMAISIFNNSYPKKFLHQLVSSQLDMDRLDYLKRDSFFSGVSEGVIGSDRIIKMLNVVDDKLVIESKGIYSIEKFLVARRLMYWQVYLHKTAMAAEQMLVHLLKRAKFLISKGIDVFAPPHLAFFIERKLSIADFDNNIEILNNFALLDDDDIMCSIKVWTNHSDPILSALSKGFINRQLWRMRIENKPFKPETLKKIKTYTKDEYQLKTAKELDYMVYSNTITNNAYSIKDDKIEILFNNNVLKDISQASDMLNLSVLGKTVRKHYVCYPKCIDDKLQSDESLF
ncbi:HD domain-containing protein [Carboxylicivirga sp. M1479]|uniref:HD domain-containing protein n=1 Tax=Carboxylicivirga sp. M1479 TaxID=2594476 RepID=UPI001177C7A6|nr:HD domain-containing protein [Carboxylicivirga sp. M1479]TRX64560.1 HD domain-containing protein [Carboxylicivirga sp. M1479]